jgi:DNA (cytosine-5)-methyltransferase 1
MTDGMDDFTPIDGSLRELALFAGAGGGILGGKLLGWRTVCAVEWDAYAASILVARQNDKSLEAFPIWDDCQTFDGRPWRGRVDVVSGGFPCTDISSAGKGAGIDGQASGMWKHMARIVGEVRPQYVLVENSPLLVRRGLARVLGDFAQMGYDARWGIVGAHHVGADHHRDRIWLLAYPSGIGVPRHVVETRCLGKTLQRGPGSKISLQDLAELQFGNAGTSGIKPLLARREDDVPNRVDRIKALGNAQHPRVVKLAWHLLGGQP